MRGNFQLILFVLESNTNRTNLDFPFFRPVGLLCPLGGGLFGVVLGGTGGVKIGTVFLKKTRVGFGRTELSLRLS